MWEAEDPISVGDTEAPLGADPGQTVVDVGLPALSIIRMLYTRILTPAARTLALGCTGSYVVDRGWLAAFGTLEDLATIESRYRAVRPPVGHALRGPGVRSECRRVLSESFGRLIRCLGASRHLDIQPCSIGG